MCVHGDVFYLEIHSLINATFAPRPVRCTYHVARSELCLLHKPHQINIPSRPSRSSNGLIPDFGNIAKRQTRPSPTQSTFSVDGALPGRRCAILAGSMHSPRLAGQIGGARTEQGRGGGDVRSGRASGSRPAQDAPVHARPGEFRPVWSGARPIMASRFLGCSQAPTDPLNAPSGRRRGGV